MNLRFVLAVSLCLCGGAIAASTAPLSAVWNVAPSGTAASTGELVFRMTPANDGDPIDVTVSIRSGTDERGVARDIRQALSASLARDRFNVQLGEGANVLVTDQKGKPDFSLELLDSDVDNLRVTVQSVDATASPTVPAQSVPATPPQTVPVPNTSSGNALPPADSPPANGGQPAASPPANSTPLPNGPAPSKATPGGAAASAPPPG